MSRHSVLILLSIMSLVACGGSSNNNPPPPPPNQAPSATAGADLAADEGSAVQLSGQASDPDGDAITVVWSQVSGPSVDIASPDTTDTAVTLPRVDIGTTATIVLRLTVTDSRGASASDDVTITADSTDFMLFLADDDTVTRVELFKYDTQTDSISKLSGDPAPLTSVENVSLSPDGRFVAFLANKNVASVRELYVASVDGQSVVRVDVPGTNSDGTVRSYAWSPDSTSLAYLADADTADVREAFVVGRDGSNQRKINAALPPATEIGSISWSQDSMMVAHQLADIGGPFGPAFDIHNTSTGANLRVLPVAPSNSLAGLTWSPDGSRLGYFAAVDADTNTSELFTVLADGTGSTQISNDPMRIMVIAYSWSQNSSRIAYQNRDQTTFSFDLSIAAADGSNNILVNAPLPPTGNVIDFQWSPDGSQIAYRADIDVDSVDDLYVAEADGSGSRKINDPLAAGGAVERYVWSPDSAMIAYGADEDGDGFTEVFVAATDGSGNTRLSSDAPAGFSATLGTATAQVWSPDSSNVAFQRVELFIADSGSNAVAQVTQPLPMPRVSFVEGPPLWSSDGSRLAYNLSEQLMATPFIQLQLRMVAPDGTEDRLISGPTVRNGQVVGVVAWSP